MSGRSSALATVGELISKSIDLDVKLMRIGALPWVWRVHFILLKYVTLARLRSGNPRLFRVGGNSILIRDLSGLGTLQSTITDFYNEVVAPGILGRSPVVVDVGANIGQFTHATKLFFPNARVLAFEPDPDVFADLESNTRGFRGVDIFNVGLGDVNSNRMFYRHELSLMSSFAAPYADMRASEELPVRRLDSVLDSDLAVDLLKVDVEGFERAVLDGGWSTVSRSRYLLVEISLGRSADVGNLELLRVVAEHHPDATIVRLGRPLGDVSRPACQDVLIAVGGSQDRDT